MQPVRIPIEIERVPAFINMPRDLLIRGRVCELVAEAQGMLNSGSFFVAGMLSGLDAMLDIDKSTLLEQVPLDDEIKAAIADYEGLMGQALRNVLSYKGSEWGALPNDLDLNLYDEAYRSSLHWSQISMLSLHD